MALEYGFGREGFQAIAGKAVKLVNDDRIERVALQGRRLKHLLERFALFEIARSGVTLVEKLSCDFIAVLFRPFAACAKLRLD